MLGCVCDTEAGKCGGRMKGALRNCDDRYVCGEHDSNDGMALDSDLRCHSIRTRCRDAGETGSTSCDDDEAVQRPCRGDGAVVPCVQTVTVNLQTLIEGVIGKNYRKSASKTPSDSVDVARRKFTCDLSFEKEKLQQRQKSLQQEQIAKQLQEQEHVSQKQWRQQQCLEQEHVSQKQWRQQQCLEQEHVSQKQWRQQQCLKQEHISIQQQQQQCLEQEHVSKQQQQQKASQQQQQQCFQQKQQQQQLHQRQPSLYADIVNGLASVARANEVTTSERQRVPLEDVSTSCTRPAGSRLPPPPPLLFSPHAQLPPLPPLLALDDASLMYDELCKDVSSWHRTELSVVRGLPLPTTLVDGRSGSCDQVSSSRLSVIWLSVVSEKAGNH